jgi:hypothetical protein
MTTDDKLSEIALAIRVAKSLRELCGALNAFRTVHYDADREPCDLAGNLSRHRVELPDLRTFGGDEPQSTLGIWSWDADSLMIYAPEGGFEICSRADYSVA